MSELNNQLIKITIDGEEYYIKDAYARQHLINLSNEKIDKVTNAGNGNFAAFLSNGSLEDSNVNSSSFVKKIDSGNSAGTFNVDGTDIFLKGFSNNSSENKKQWNTINSGLSDSDKTNLDSLVNNISHLYNVQPDWNETNTSSYAYILNKPEIGPITNVYDGKVTFNLNGNEIGNFSANQQNNSSINISLNASDVGALSNNTSYGANISLSFDNSTSNLSAELKDQEGNDLSYTTINLWELKNVQPDWNETNTSSYAYILNKPQVNNGSLTIAFDGVNVSTFYANDINHLSLDINKSCIGLGAVNNTSDLNKPISNATQIALNGKICNITSLSTIYDGAGSGSTGTNVLPTNNVSNGTIYYCYNANGNTADTIGLATSIQWQTGFLAQATVNNDTVTWSLRTVCQSHAIYIDLATETLYRYTNEYQIDTRAKLIQIGGSDTEYIDDMFSRATKEFIDSLY